MAILSIQHHHFFHGEAAVSTALADIRRDIKQLIERVNTMSVQLDALTAEVARNTAVDESAIVLLNGLAAQIVALKTDPVALQALADSLQGSSNALAAAVIANTPAA